MYQPAIQQLVIIGCERCSNVIKYDTKIKLFDELFCCGYKCGGHQDTDGLKAQGHSTKDLSLMLNYISSRTQILFVSSSLNILHLRSLHISPQLFQTYCTLLNKQFPYRLIFVLDKFRPKKPHSRKEPFKCSKIPKFGLKNVVMCEVMCGKYSLTKFANFLIIVLRAEIATTFVSKMVAISARNIIMRKFANFVRLYFPYFTRFRDEILKFYYFRKVLFGNFVFFVWICL